MFNRNNLTFVVGLCALCFALGETASAGHSAKQVGGKIEFVEYLDKDNKPSLDGDVQYINEHSLKIVTPFSRGGTTAGFLCVPSNP
jgi:hypothetical protein